MRLPSILLALFLSLWLLPARADWLLATPTVRVVPGQVFEIVVIGEPPDGNWPEHLSARVAQSGNEAQIVVRLSATGKPSPGQHYVGQWPMEIQGVATLILNEAQLLFEAVPENLANEPLPTTKKVEAEALSFHEPMYLVVGGHSPVSVRYQLSFRYRIFDDNGIVASHLPLMRGLYFGYTQTSLWDIESESKPFRDTSYRPSLFYQWQVLDPPLGNSLTLAGGFEHESNGRDGDKSRSINLLFVRADLRYHLPESSLYVGLEPKLWYYAEKSENPDIARYRGYGHLGLRFGSDEGLMLSTILRMGTSGKGSAQVDLSYPLRRSMFSGVGTFIHLQYFVGYGETLLDYNQKRSSQLRLGVSVAR